MLELPFGYDPRWFEASAAACRLQAASGVGLVHGIAHTLEAPLHKEHPQSDWGHAKLCAVFLLPVLRFNLAHSPKFTNYAAEFGVDAGAVLAVARRLFEPESYAEAMTLVPAQWTAIARDRCSRMNHVLVRASAVEFFKEFKAE
jgi:alcohol dehydrogenase class IV